MDDKTLVSQALAGDQAAFSTLVERYQTQVYNLALRMVCNEQDALDLSQETFLRAWRGLSQFQFFCQFSTWLYRLASNCCIDFLRRQKRHRTVSMTTGDEAARQTDLPDRQPPPEEQLLQREHRTQLESALALLEPEHRQILMLRVMCDLPYEQIALVLDVPVGTVKSRLARARAQLRKKLDAAGNQRAERPSVSIGKEDA